MKRGAFLGALAVMTMGAGCLGSQGLPTFTEADLHKAVCVAKGETVIALTDSPTEQALRLENLVRFDDDCRAVFGDAAVKITVTESLDPDGGAQ